MLNRVNSLMRVMSRGTVQVLNTYQTEEHDRLLYRHFRRDLKDACRMFVHHGVITSAQGEDLARLPLRAKGGPKLGLVGLASLICETASAK